MKRVLFLTNYSSPYRVEFFDILGQRSDLTVLYSDRKEKKTHRSADWFISGTGSYHCVQLSRRAASIRGRDLCLDVIDWLKKPFDAIVIHGYSTPTALLAIYYLKSHRIPFFMEVDGGLVRQESFFKYQFKKCLVSSASAWLSTGRVTKDFLVHYGAKEDLVYTFPFTSLRESDILSDTVSAFDKQSLRQELQIEEPKVILAIGQFIRRKGFDVLLKAAEKLPRDVGIYIVGGLPTEEYLQMHRELGLTNVHFAGFQKKELLIKYYQAADLFVLPTREDIWGLVVGEAMANGLPVITTEGCVAGLELVENGVNGYLIPVNDENALAEKIETVFAGHPAQMGAAALETIRPYTYENMAKVHMDILEGRR